jgi:hypothetical protein
MGQIRYSGLGLDQAAFFGDDDRLGAAARLEFFEHGMDVKLHRAFGKEEPGGNLAVGEAIRQETKDFQLPGGEGVGPSLNLRAEPREGGSGERLASSFPSLSGRREVMP